MELANSADDADQLVGKVRRRHIVDVWQLEIPATDRRYRLKSRSYHSFTMFAHHGVRELIECMNELVYDDARRR